MRILTPFILAASLVLPLSGMAFAQTAAPATISVTGEATVQARPDTATVMLGVTTFGDTAAAALAANNTSIASVMDLLKAAGVADTDMQTSNLSLNPDYSSYDSSSGAPPARYVATNMLNVQVRDLAKLGEVLDAAVKDGANTLNGLTFGVAEPRPQMDEARKLAVADARARAELLAEAAGVALGPIQAINDGGSFANPTPMFRREASMDAVPVASGELGITASVQVTFLIGG